jgi:hypothetical protein
MAWSARKVVDEHAISGRNLHNDLDEGKLQPGSGLGGNGCGTWLFACIYPQSSEQAFYDWRSCCNLSVLDGIASGCFAGETRHHEMSL